MITKAGTITFGKQFKNLGSRFQVSSFTFGESKNVYYDLGDWLFDNFKEEFKDMGLQLVKLEEKDDNDMER